MLRKLKLSCRPGAGWASTVVLLAGGLHGALAVEPLAPGFPDRPAAEAPAVALDDQSRPVEEMEVELALLADPRTFACPLTAHGSSVEVVLRGSVPDEDTLDLAMNLARANCPLPVRDEVEINASLPRRLTYAPSCSLQRAACAALSGVFGLQATHFHVTAGDDGRIGITGTVPTYPEKLAASRVLRSVPTCHSVQNELVVMVRPRVTLHTAMTTPKLISPVAPSEIVPTGAVEPQAPVVAPSVAVPPAPVSKTEKITPVPTASVEKLAAVPVSKALSTVQEKRPAPSQSPYNAIRTVKYTVTESPVVPAPTPPAVSTPAAPRGVVSTPSSALPVPMKPVPHTTTAPEKHTTTLVPVPGQEPIWKVFRLLKPNSRETTSSKTSQTVRPASYSTPAAVSGHPAESGKPLSVSHVQQRIRSACGKGLKDAAVSPPTGTEVKVRVTIKDARDAEAIAGKVLELPELAPYKVVLEVVVEP